MFHNNTEENSPLIKKDKTPLRTIIYNNLTYYTSAAGQIGLGTVGLGAGFLYAGPATTCAQAPTCGLWFSNLTNEKVAIAVFFAGGLNYAGINAYFSSVSVNNFFTFEAKQASWLARLGWGSAILFYTASQSASSFLSSTSTNSKLWQTALTVAGAAPGNLYSAVSTAQYEIPMLMSYLLRNVRYVQESFSDIFFTPDAAEMHVRNQRLHYFKTQHDFLKSVDGRWSRIKSSPHKRPVQSADTPLSYLFSSPEAASNKCFLRHVAQRSGQLVAAGMGSAISVPFIINNFQTINNYVPNVPAGALTAYFSYSFTYSNYKLCMNFIEGLISILDNIITGRPIDSLVFQLHPYVTMASFALVLAISAMSFALMNTIYEMVFPQENITREVFRYATDASMVLYHIAGLYQLYELLVSKLSRNEQDKFLFRVEAEVDHLHKMTPNEFIQFTETNTDDMNQMLGISTFKQAPTSINDAERAAYQQLNDRSTFFGASERRPEVQEIEAEIHLAPAPN